MNQIVRHIVEPNLSFETKEKQNSTFVIPRRDLLTNR